MQPHIALSTLTRLFEGELIHRDSLDRKQLIWPGTINWMTAGNDIVHFERGIANNKPTIFNGLQRWLALPPEQQVRAHSFQHIAQANVPQWHASGLAYQFIAHQQGRLNIELANGVELAA